MAKVNDIAINKSVNKDAVTLISLADHLIKVLLLRCKYHVRNIPITDNIVIANKTILIDDINV